MFDRYETTHISGPEIIRATVHEHRAPTDESVRLLHELEEEAIKKIEQSIRVGDASFECVIHQMNDHANNQIKIVAMFSLNGKKMAYRCSIPPMDFTAQKLFEKIVDGISKEIAIEAIAKALGPSFFQHPWGKN